MNAGQYQQIAIVGDGHTYCLPCATTIYGRQRLSIMERDEDFVEDHSGGLLRCLIAYQVADDTACDVCSKPLK